MLITGTGVVKAQNFQVSGRVTDTRGGGISGATIIVKGNNSRGTTTDAQGRYSINALSPDDVLIFSFLGYKTEETAVRNRKTINVQLEEDATLVDDVVVIGYGVQKRQFLVGSVSQVSNKELLKAPMTNVSNMMTGKLPGVTSIQRSGQPGSDQTTLLVRGASTFNDSSPLCIVDGVERMINTVNPNDIESISILKDAATSAIYGVRGANGIILITTKSGSKGEASISYDGSVTFSTNTSMPELLNARDYIGWHNKAREMDGLNPLWTDEVIAGMKEKGIYGDTDWLNLLFKKYGFTHQHNISATGGTDKIKYYTSIGLMDQDGILPNTSYKRFNVRSNIDAKIARNLNLSVNLSGFREKKHAPGYSIAKQNEFSPVSQAIYALPILAPTYKGMPQGYLNGVYTQQPIAAINQSGYTDQQRWQFEGNAKLEYDFGSIDALQGLKAAVHVSYDYSNTVNRNYMSSFKLMSFSTTTMDSSEVNASGINTLNDFNRSASDGDSFTVRPTLTYNRDFGRHSVGGLFFYEQRKGYSETMTGYKKGYYANYPVDLSIGNTWEGISVPVTGSFGETGIASFAGRFNYAFDKKYLFEFTFRADASYKFAPENRWGFFPSAAVGWVMSEEKFFRQALPAIDFLKLRASYGELGSDDTAAYLYMQSYSSTAPNPSYIIGGTGHTAYYTTNYVYKDLTWSRTRSFNFGLDMSVWGGKLGIEFDWFYKVTDNILEQVSGSYAPSLGGNVPSYKNSGKVDNRGFELVLKHNNYFASGWRYSLTGSLSWARNKALAKQISDNHPMYRAILGKPMGSIYGFKAAGLYQTEEQIANSPTAPSGEKRLGDLMYVDINGDGKIEQSQDFVKIGRSYTPEMNFSLNMEVAYKNLYLTALWQGVALCSYQLSAAYDSGVFDNTMYTRPFYSSGNAPYYLVEKAWREDNRNADYPRLSTVANGNNAWPSSWWVKNGAYLRLKNLQIGYTLPEHILKNTGIGKINIYVAGTNLLTFSAFKYVDPEMPSVNNGYYPQQRTYSIGVNLTF
nr:TonB-dependent receptor [uncultured Alistipes sp.]